MSISFLDNESQDAVNLFWQRCGEVEPFPRKLERAVALALPLTLVKLPQLRLRDIESWLHRRKVAFQFNCESRSVRGCLVAFGGNGFIFVDGSDSEDQLRFTVAHEVAHFMIDYWLPRHKAIKKFGPAIAEIFDGLRPSSITVQLHSIFANTTIGIHTFLMERDAEGETLSQIWKVEDRADEIALALLAPPEEVLSHTDISTLTFNERHIAITTSLTEVFGLPKPVAKTYGHLLLRMVGKGPSWVEALKLK